MNKQNLKLLIETIKDKKNKFNWANSEMCLGHYARNLLGKPFISGINGLQQFLEICPLKANRLYRAQDFEGVEIISRKTYRDSDRWMSSYYSSRSRHSHRRKAIAYLESLL
jgi:hypothetical protein